MSRWCLHLVAHGLHLSSANSHTYISITHCYSPPVLIAVIPKTFFGALHATFQAKFESGDEFHGY